MKVKSELLLSERQTDRDRQSGKVRDPKKWSRDHSGLLKEKVR